MPTARSPYRAAGCPLGTAERGAPQPPNAQCGRPEPVAPWAGRVATPIRLPTGQLATPRARGTFPAITGGRGRRRRPSHQSRAARSRRGARRREQRAATTDRHHHIEHACGRGAGHRRGTQERVGSGPNTPPERRMPAWVDGLSDVGCPLTQVRASENADSRQVHFERLVIESGSETFTLDLHPRLPSWPGRPAGAGWADQRAGVRPRQRAVRRPPRARAPTRHPLHHLPARRRAPLRRRRRPHPGRHRGLPRGRRHGQPARPRGAQRAQRQAQDAHHRAGPRQPVRAGGRDRRPGPASTRAGSGTSRGRCRTARTSSPTSPPRRRDRRGRRGVRADRAAPPRVRGGPGPARAVPPPVVHGRRHHRHRGRPRRGRHGPVGRHPARARRAVTTALSIVFWRRLESARALEEQALADAGRTRT